MTMANNASKVKAIAMDRILNIPIEVSLPQIAPWGLGEPLADIVLSG